MKKYLKFKFILVLLASMMVVGLMVYLVWFAKKSGAPTLSASPSATATLYPKVEKLGVPILMYHYIRIAPAGDQLGANLSVTPENFAGQVKYLYDDNYRTIKLADLADPDRQAISKVYFEKKKPIVLTFDDGYEDAYTEAFPILKQHDFIGTFFIITDYVGREGRLTQPQIEEMSGAGMEFGSHTLTHPDLTKISLDDANNQIINSKGEWSVFCYPSGRFNDEVENLAKEAGYLAAVTTKIGIARENSNLWELPRVRIENTDVQAFADKISYATEQ